MDRMRALSIYDLTERERYFVKQEVNSRCKSSTIAWILWAFLGIFGAHRLYLGKLGTGLAMLLLSLTVIISFIWWIVDAFLLNSMLRENREQVEREVLEDMALHRELYGAFSDGKPASSVHQSPTPARYDNLPPTTPSMPATVPVPRSNTYRPALDMPKTALPPQQGTVVAIARLVLPDNHEIPISGSSRLIGRNDFGNSTSTDNLKIISRRHFNIFTEGGKFYIEDVGSTGGTKVNGYNIQGKGKFEIRDGDVIEPANAIKATFKAG